MFLVVIYKSSICCLYLHTLSLFFLAEQNCYFYVFISHRNTNGELHREQSKCSASVLLLSENRSHTPRTALTWPWIFSLRPVCLSPQLSAPLPPGEGLNAALTSRPWERGDMLTTERHPQVIWAISRLISLCNIKDFDEIISTEALGVILLPSGNWKSMFPR